MYCEICVLAKSHRHSYKSNNTRVDSTFALVHSDVWGPLPVVGGQGFKYFLLYIDDCTRMTWACFMKQKNDVFEHFSHFYTLVQTQFRKPIKILRSDNGGEFLNSKMKTFFHDKGLVLHTMCPYTPEQNDVAERMNRTLLEMARTMLIKFNTPRNFWLEAIAASVYLTNRLPSSTLDLQNPCTLTPNPSASGVRVLSFRPYTET